MNIMNELREKEIEESIGTICEHCNKNAFYFNRKNTDFNTKESCLICLKKHVRGVLLEDFVFTLSRHIPKHYKLIENNMSELVSLRDILQRFTYENETVIEKLTLLLCKEIPSYFKTEGKYKSIIDSSFIESARKSVIAEWNEISREVKHTRRFTNKRALDFYENIIGTCMFNVEKESNEFNSALTKIKKGTSLFRGRIVQNNTHKETIKSSPEKELAAPPEYLAGSNRMSPSGISFMYTAGDYHTAIAELRPYISDTIAIGEFVTKKDLNFFDFTLLDNIKIKDPNILEDPNSKFFRYRYLLHKLHDLISRPVRPTDVSYIDIQVLSETIRNYKDGIFNGIKFKSSQKPKGFNYVLFGDYDDEKKAKDYHVELDNDRKVAFFQVTEIVTTATKV
ncbi:RES family NAD+ phosphorylase [Aeromonas sp. 1805]|uniref:RES family NAD+ phosphorylase n=1 Tax=Aeromonas sp. 1805 TaxID=2560028 RepID=UPI00209C1AA4|nr:RES family NAD+ phosphorylase [Aeromonas sp. 1805]